MVNIQRTLMRAGTAVHNSLYRASGDRTDGKGSRHTRVPDQRLNPIQVDLPLQRSSCEAGAGPTAEP
jgi:hypothetical protein